jgi:hypothetical protein
MRTVWGAASGAAFLAATQGKSPITLPVNLFRGVPMKIRTAAADSVENPARHTDERLLR